MKLTLITLIKTETEARHKGPRTRYDRAQKVHSGERNVPGIPKTFRGFSFSQSTPVKSIYCVFTTYERRTFKREHIGLLWNAQLE